MYSALIGHLNVSAKGKHTVNNNSCKTLYTTLGSIPSLGSGDTSGSGFAFVFRFESNQLTLLQGCGLQKQMLADVKGVAQEVVAQKLEQLRCLEVPIGQHLHFEIHEAQVVSLVLASGVLASEQSIEQSRSRWACQL